MKKILLILMILALASAVSAVAPLEECAVTKVSIDGVDMEEESAVYVESGQQIAVEAVVSCTNLDPADAKLEARIGGYEYDAVYASTGLFEVVGYVSGLVLYRKSLILDIPEDMDTDSNDYQLMIILSDKKTIREFQYNLFVSEPRHKVKIQDVMLSPSSSVDAGKPLMVKARIENFGQKQEKDVKVVAEIKELGISGRAYVDELPAFDEEGSVVTSGSIFLNIPEDARTGDYEIYITAYYGGRAKYYYATHETKYIHVDGIEPQPLKTDALVSITSSLITKPEQMKSVKIMITNLGSNARTYTIEVGDTLPWAELKMGQDSITVGSGAVGELSLNIMPVIEGSYTLPVAVKEDGQEIKRANVAITIENRGIAASTGWVLGIGGALVAVILIIVLFSFHGDKIGQEDLDVENGEESEPTVQSLRKPNGESDRRPPRAPEGSSAFRKLE
ncbi:MAG: hypothetical protein ABIB71_00775 [Candidatus Woesearchaeota archaeon]